MSRYRCDECGALAEGKPDELYRKGWRRKSRKKNNRVLYETGCPTHAELVERDAR